MKDILSKLDSIETPVAGVSAPVLPSPIQLDESAQLRVLAGQSTLLTESKKVKEPKEKKEEKVKEEQQVECLDDDMEEELEESDAQAEARAKFENLVTKVAPSSKPKTATEKSKSPIGSGKKDGKGGAEFKKEMDKHMKEDSKPSAGLTKKEKSAVVKKAVAGKDIGKKGKGFEKVEKAAKKSGAKDPKAVAAAAMWKGQVAKKKTVKESVEPKLTFKQMVSLVQESGGQQQIDAVDTELFAWAQRVASAKFTGIKQELYAGMVYENMGGEFRMYDVLSEAEIPSPQMARQPDVANQDQPVPDYIVDDFDDHFYDLAWHKFDESEPFFDAIKAIGRAHVTNQNDSKAVAQLVHVIKHIYGTSIDQYIEQHKDHYQTDTNY